MLHGPTMGVFVLVFFMDFYGLFCNGYYKQFIIVIIERCGFFSYNWRVEIDLKFPALLGKYLTINAIYYYFSYFNFHISNFRLGHYISSFF